MLDKFIAPIAGVVTAHSTGVIIDKTTKLLLKSTLPAVPAFAVDLGIKAASVVIGGYVSSLVVKNLSSVVETVTTDEPEESTQESH